MRIYLLIFFFSCLAAPVYASDIPASHAAESQKAEKARYGEIAERFDSLFHVLSKRRGFNGNVLVSTDSNIVYENSFGYSDYRNRKRLSIGSAFEIASVSKQFTAMAVMMLHDEGKIDFDDTVTKFFPAFPYKKITIRHLLGHRSGLPDYMAFALKYRKEDVLTNAGLMQMMEEYTPESLFEPDTDYRYSNTGYAVLASVIEKVSGEPYDKFMNGRIFAPLGMNSTFVYNFKGNNPTSNLTKGYNRRGRPVGGDGYLNGVVGGQGNLFHC